MFFQQAPMYDPEMVRPMSDELVSIGARELKTAADVDAALKGAKGTALVIVNSVCGCAAGGARPGVALSLQNDVIPDAIYTVFAGVDREATARAREFFAPFPPSSPSIALLKDGKIVEMVERHQIEGNGPDGIAAILVRHFAKHCTAKGPSIPAEQFASLKFVQACGSKIAAATAKKYAGQH